MIRLASGDLIAAGQSVFRVRVDQTPISSKEASSPSPSSSASRSEGDGLTAIKCTCCGTPAPQDITIVGPIQGDATEVIQWWCSSCRSELAALPQPVPHYTTLREIGRGAMGVVYQARHNLTGQKVALKLIMPEAATTRTAIDRFYCEMSVISQLRHPNIVEWYEQGRFFRFKVRGLGFLTVLS